MKKPILVFLACLPILSMARWIVRSWIESPLDRSGPVYLGTAIVLALIFRKSIKKINLHHDSSAMSLLLCSACGLVVGHVMDINFLSALSSLGMLLGMVWVLWGWYVFIWAVPLFGLAVLSLPTTTYLMNMFVNGLVDASILKPVAGILVVAVFARVVILVHRGALSRIRHSKSAYLVGVGVFAIGLWLYVNPGLRGNPFQPLCASLEVDAWLHSEVKLAPAEAVFFKNTDIKKVMFCNEVDGRMLVFLSIAAGENIHQLHPPEYCMLGSGWKVTGRKKMEIDRGDTLHNVTRLRVTRGNVDLMVYYWFSSEHESTPDYTVYRQLCKSKKADWKLFEFSTEIKSDETTAEETLQDFLCMLD